MKLTASNVRTIAAPGGKSDHIEWDSALPGFGLRCAAEIGATLFSIASANSNGASR